MQYINSFLNPRLSAIVFIFYTFTYADNYSLSFDGVDDYVEIADNASFPSGTSDFTFSAWINIDDMADDHRIILCSKTLDHFQFVLNKIGCAFLLARYAVRLSADLRVRP
mgnify:CR=1 FL=1